LTLKAPASAAQMPVTLVSSAPTETASQPSSAAQVDLLGLGMMICIYAVWTFVVFYDHIKSCDI